MQGMEEEGAADVERWAGAVGIALPTVPGAQHPAAPTDARGAKRRAKAELAVGLSGGGPRNAQRNIPTFCGMDAPRYMQRQNNNESSSSHDDR